MAGMSRKSRMFNYLNSEITLEMNTGRTISGIFFAYDKFLNVVLKEAVETRTKVVKKVDTIVSRDLGLCLVRGDNIVAVKVDGLLGNAPPSREALRTNVALPGNGQGMRGFLYKHLLCRKCLRRLPVAIDQRR
ncbi:putative small nuclear ribonucleoprotein-associated protein B [Diplonema papillatum]|nr:putative small nuclear ribonucleoprotein-associated protein B [Diplonema papillatum]